jgi:hypothetical protein
MDDDAEVDLRWGSIAQGEPILILSDNFCENVCKYLPVNYRLTLEQANRTGCQAQLR